MEFKRAISYALSLLLKRDYSEKTLKEKILSKFPNLSEKELSLIIEELSLQGFLNEYRAAWSYFDSKVKKGWGRRKISFSLKQKGFKLTVIREVELTYQFDYSYIGKLLKKKFPGGLKGKKERERALRFLLQRGFTFSEAENLVRELLK